MSFARIALRLTTMEALRPSAVVAANGPFPTMAGTHVFDSRVAPISDVSPDERRPIAVVYTERDYYNPGQRAGGPPFLHLIDLVVQTSLVVRDTGAAEYTVGVPATDAELDASLDLFEAQILFCLVYGPTGALWRKLTGRRILDIQSAVHRDSEDGARLAERTMTIRVAVDEDEFDPAPAVDPAGLDRLPEPLRSIVAELAAGAYGAALAQGLAAAAPVMPTAVPLRDVSLAAQPHDPPAAKVEGAPQIDAAANNLDV